MKCMILALILGACSLSAHSALIYRGNGLVYDSNQDITWFRDADYANTSGYIEEGLMNWAEAVEWAENLEFAGYDDWRLPTTMQPDPSCSGQGEPDPGIYESFGTGCSGGEMGYLFYEYGISARDPSCWSCGGNPGIFQNLHGYEGPGNPNDYWSGTEREFNSADAWVFNFGTGSQWDYPQDFYERSGAVNHAWAVRDGDVAAVPIPAAVWLFGSALGLLGWIRRKAS